MSKWFRGPFTEPESEDEAYKRVRPEMDDNELHALAEEVASSIFDRKEGAREAAYHALAKLQQAHERRAEKAEAEIKAMRKEMWALSEIAANRSAIEKVREELGPLSLWTANGLELVKKEACTAAVAEALERALNDIKYSIRSLKPRSDLVCVPREPTREMLSALMGDPLILAASDEQIGREAWKRMLAAAEGKP